jgi:outer membrane usher protein
LLCQSVSASTTLPPPPLSVAGVTSPAAETTLYLDLTVNGVAIGNVVPVQQVGSDLRVRISDLQAAGVNVARLGNVIGRWVSLGQTAGVRHRYDANALLLEVTVPAEWLAMQRLGEASREAPRASSGTGFVLNYGMHVVDGDEQPMFASLWSEQRLFGGYGVIRNTGMHRYSESGSGWRIGARQRGYVRFDTAWTNSNEQQLHSWTVGDLITSSQTWSSPARIAGIKLSRDFRLRPDLITYPLPEFSGQAAVPSTLDLFINGQRVRSESLRPGPYTITTVPQITGAGEATLVTTDMFGRQVTTTMPFYASSDLLRRGLADYSLSLGVMRRDYGVENFSYGRFAGAASLRYGVTDAITVEGQAEIASTATGTFGLMGLGTVMTAGTFGVFNGAMSRSANYGAQGWQYSFGYRYANRGFNIGYQGVRTSADFYTLATADGGARLSSAADSDIVTAGLSMSGSGSLSLSHIRVQPPVGRAVRMLNLSYAAYLSDGMSLRVGASRDLVLGENAFTAQVLASFGRNGNLSVGSERGTSSREYIEYSRSVPTHGGFGWHLGHANGSDDNSFTNASLAWSGRYARAEAGVTAYPDQTSHWADLRGSLLVMDGEVFAARQINDAFVVVSTEGLAGVPVRYENQLVGYTNDEGRLLVPWVTPHYAARFSIDPIDLPADVEVVDAEQRLVVKRNSGALLSFSTRRLVASLIKLVDHEGQPLPVGSQATETMSGQTGTVGYDGLVYFEDLPAHPNIHIQRPDGRRCRVEADLPEASAGLTQVGPLTCEEVP